MLTDQRAALTQRAEHFLDEVEQRGRALDMEECERLAELLVHLGGGRPHDGLDEAAVAMSQLETLLMTHARMPGRKAPTDLPTIAEYRALLKLVRDGR